MYLFNIFHISVAPVSLWAIEIPSRRRVNLQKVLDDCNFLVRGCYVARKVVGGECDCDRRAVGNHFHLHLTGVNPPVSKHRDELLKSFLVVGKGPFEFVKVVVGF